MIVSFAKEHLQVLVDALRQRDMEVVGPRLGEGAVVYGSLQSIDDIPRGWVEEQEAGVYRLRPQPDEDRFFAFANGPQSAKNFFHPSRVCLWKSQKTEDGFTVEPAGQPRRRLALLGLRACDLAAIAVQDNVFLEQGYRDPWYADRRESAFIIGVNCARAGGTCFCVSMKTGPEITRGDDLTLTELRDVFLAQPRTPEAEKLLAELETSPATDEQLQQARLQHQETARQMGRSMPTEGLPALLKRNLQHPRWEEVGERCLTCTNCTMVCPTCFCFTVEDVTDLTGEQASRERTWDSCFTTEFTLTSGTSQRSSNAARYRQWLTHKLSSWHDQFDESGCVGCGRCITWCPVGIDITEEVAAIAATDGERRDDTA